MEKVKYSKEIVKDLKKFTSEKISDNLDYYDTIFGNVILCRVYRYEAEGTDTSIINPVTNKPYVNEQKRRVICIGRVLRKGSSCTYAVEEGDIVALNDDLIGQAENPAFIDYILETNNEQTRGIDAYAPPKTISSFLMWRKQYGFLIDKVKDQTEFNSDDFFTFLLPEGFIKAKLDKKKLNTWLSGLQ